MFHSQVIHAQNNIPTVKYREFPEQPCGNPAFVSLELKFDHQTEISLFFHNIEDTRRVGRAILKATETFMFDQINAKSFVDPAMA